MIRGPAFWLWISFIFLAVVQISNVVRDPYFALPPKPNGDGVDYENIAWNVSEGNGFGFDWQDPKWRRPYLEAEGGQAYRVQLERDHGFGLTTARPPLYPFLIATVYTILERGPSAWMSIRILNGLCLAVGGALSVYFSIRILRDLGLGRWPTILGGMATFFLAWMDRTTATYASDFLTEPLAYLLTQLFVFVLHCHTSLINGSGMAGRMSRWSWIALGCLLALMVLTRSIMVFMLPGIGLILGVSIRFIPSSIEDLAKGNSLNEKSVFGPWLWSCRVLLLTLLLLSPWWVRNCLVVNRFMPLGTQGSISLLGGYCDEALMAGGEWQSKPELLLRAELQANDDFNSLKDDAEREVFLAEEALRRVRKWTGDHWSELGSLGLQRAFILWSPFSGRSLFWKGLMLLGCVGLLVTRRPEAIWMLGLPILTTLVVMLLYSTGSRFLVPCYGLLYSLGGIGLGLLSSWIVGLVRTGLRSSTSSDGSI